MYGSCCTPVDKHSHSAAYITRSFLGVSKLLINCVINGKKFYD